MQWYMCNKTQNINELFSNIYICKKYKKIRNEYILCVYVGIYGIYWYIYVLRKITEYEKEYVHVLLNMCSSIYITNHIT